MPPSGLSYEEFCKFIDGLALQQDMIKFWHQFLFVDCFAYISLFIATRYRNWELRVGSIKQLAAIFSAYDRPLYQKLVPKHIHDILSLPEFILHHLRKGIFSVRLSSTQWHAVAVDECHEMCINKDTKMAVVRPSKEE